MAENNKGYETYYVPENSWFPICASMSVGAMLIGVATWLNDLKANNPDANPYLLMAGLVGLIFVLWNWFGTAIRENIQGKNSAQLKRSYRMGMQWFIFSEVMFFATFFGALFYVRHFAGPWLAGEGDRLMTNQLLWKGFTFEWPLMHTPQDAIGGIANQVQAHLGVFKGPEENMSPKGWSELIHWLPFWNTLLLVGSSVTCEFAHHALKAGNRSGFKLWLLITLAMGFTFVGLQALEYHEAYTELGLTLHAGTYGTTFFMLTGFHGFHVCLGATMLLIMFIRALKGHFNATDHFGFEAASWYWHFVDVVWLFLVAVVYVF